LGNLFNKIARDPINQLVSNAPLKKYSEQYNSLPQGIFLPVTQVAGAIQPGDLAEIKQLLQAHTALTPQFSENEFIPSFIKSQAQK